MDLTQLAAQPTLVGGLVRLEPLGPEHFDGLRALFGTGEEDAESPLASALAYQVRTGLASAAARRDRADWAIVRHTDGRAVGEVVLFELDEDHETMTFRIALVGPEVFDHGYGSEATRLVRDFAFGPLGLRRLRLDVVATNERAVTVYERAGFVLEGRMRQAQRVDGQWVDVLHLALLDSDRRP